MTVIDRNSLIKAATYYEKQQIKLKGSGDWKSALCPFHQDKNPSLRVNANNGAFRCMSCGIRGGDVIAFHMQKYKLGFVDACKALKIWR